MNVSEENGKCKIEFTLNNPEKTNVYAIINLADNTYTFYDNY